MADYNRINTMVYATVLSSPRKIAICPFAEEGMLAKQILNQRYGIVEDYIVDNRLAEINPNVLTTINMKREDLKGLFVLLVISNREINQFLEKQLEQLREIEPEIIIQNIIRPIRMIVPSARDYFDKIKKSLLVKCPVEKNKLVRFGKKHDGGYVLLDDFDSSMNVYSFGISNDVSFEKDLANRGLTIFMYDHTIGELPEYHENFCYRKIGISHIDEIEHRKLSLKTLLEENGDIGNNNLILKMDVEGAEWDVIMNTSSEIWKQFKQMTFEFHRVEDLSNPNILPALQKLNRTHQIVWVHGNNYGYVGKAGDIEIPAYLELTYLNKMTYQTSSAICRFPLDMDMPSDPSIEEIVLGNWGIPSV